MLVLVTKPVPRSRLLGGADEDAFVGLGKAELRVHFFYHFEPFSAGVVAQVGGDFENVLALF